MKVIYNIKQYIIKVIKSLENRGILLKEATELLVKKDSLAH